MENIVLLPSQNTYVSSEKNTTNYAYSNILCCGNQSTHAQFRAFLYFDLCLMPQNIIIESARLKMFRANPKGNDTKTNLNPYIINSDWNQFDLTWNNQPDFNSSIFGKQIDSLKDYLDCWDVSNIVKQWFLDKSSNSGLILLSPEINEGSFRRYYSTNSNNSEFYPALHIKFSYKHSFCIGSRTIISEIETFVTREDLLFSSWKNTSQFSMYTFIVQNLGMYPIYALPQISPNRQLAIDDGALFSIPPGSAEAIVPQRYAFFSRLCFKCSGGASSKIKIWFQAQI